MATTLTALTEVAEAAAVGLKVEAMALAVAGESGEEEMARTESVLEVASGLEIEKTKGAGAVVNGLMTGTVKTKGGGKVAMVVEMGKVIIMS